MTDTSSHSPIHVIGGGLAGSEASWQIANAGVPVILHEMRGVPGVKTDAHHTDGLAELVCSNSFRSDDWEYNAVGLLHAEMRALGSIIMECGDAHQVPAGGALAVDRDGFSQAVTAKLEAHLPTPKTPAQLRKISDDRYLSTMALRVFRAGLKHSLVDAKWPAFEQVFFGFDPEKVVLMGAEHLERLMQDTRLIRHLGKLKSVPRNAQFILDVQKEKGSFGALIADWPVTDIVGLWKYLSKHGHQLGGLSAPRFLRMVGKDTFIPTEDMAAALIAP